MRSRKLSGPQTNAADGVVRGRDRRAKADGGVAFHRAGGEREFLPTRRPLRLAFIEREHGAGVLSQAFVTWFNAGLRAIDIRDPYRPREVGYFIPSITEATEKRCVKVDGQDR